LRTFFRSTAFPQRRRRDKPSRAYLRLLRRPGVPPWTGGMRGARNGRGTFGENYRVSIGPCQADGPAREGAGSILEGDRREGQGAQGTQAGMGQVEEGGTTKGEATRGRRREGRRHGVQPRHRGTTARPPQGSGFKLQAWHFRRRQGRDGPAVAGRPHAITPYPAARPSGESVSPARHAGLARTHYSSSSRLALLADELSSAPKSS
jgi:hypothetical protein